MCYQASAALLDAPCLPKLMGGGLQTYYRGSSSLLPTKNEFTPSQMECTPTRPACQPGGTTGGRPSYSSAASSGC